jgi:hypothetical protein
MQPQPGGVETLGYGSECLYASPTLVSLLIPKWFPLLENGGNHFGVFDCTVQDGRAATLTYQRAQRGPQGLRLASGWIVATSTCSILSVLLTATRG